MNRWDDVFFFLMGVAIVLCSAAVGGLAVGLLIALSNGAQP